MKIAFLFLWTTLALAACEHHDSSIPNYQSEEDYSGITNPNENCDAASWCAVWECYHRCEELNGVDAGVELDDNQAFVDCLNRTCIFDASAYANLDRCNENTTDVEMTNLLLQCIARHDYGTNCDPQKFCDYLACADECVTEKCIDNCTDNNTKACELEYGYSYESMLDIMQSCVSHLELGACNETMFCSFYSCGLNCQGNQKCINACYSICGPACDGCQELSVVTDYMLRLRCIVNDGTEQ